MKDKWLNMSCSSKYLILKYTVLGTGLGELLSIAYHCFFVSLQKCVEYLKELNTLEWWNGDHCKLILERNS